MMGDGVAAFWAGAVADAGMSGLLRTGVSVPDLAVRARGRQVYVATPFTLRLRGRTVYGRGVAAHRVAVEAAQALDALAREGVSAVSPVLMAVSMIQSRSLSEAPTAQGGYLDHAFWMDWSRRILEASGAVWVPDMDGWQASVGIAREVEWALARNVRVFVEGQVGHAGN